MKQYDLEVCMNIKALVPDSLVQKFREQAQQELAGGEATPFIEYVNKIEDDDEFMLAHLRYALRRVIQASVKDLFDSVGIGGTLSPVRAMQQELELIQQQHSEAQDRPVLATQL